MTSLQDQLQRIAAAAGISTAKHVVRGKPSLLYSPQEAADIGLHDIYEIGVQGFEQLCKLDPRFQSYRKTLFSQATQGMDRDQQTAEVNAKLDASIAGFCSLLASYFLLPAAFKALEYLIRRFKVNEVNVEALMHAALPFHSSHDFVQLVQTLVLEGTPFAFLAPMQKSGVALPRALLVQRCLADRTLLRFVFEAAQSLGAARVAASAVMPFFAVLLCEIAATAPAIDETLLSMLLPYILHGLGPHVSPDYRAAIYMVLVQLSTRATFSADLVTTLVLELCGTASAAGLAHVLLVLCHLAVTQPTLNSLPEAAFKSLAKLPTLPAELRALEAKAPHSQKLVDLMVAAVGSSIQAHESYAKLAEEIASAVPLGEAAPRMAEVLLEAAAETGSGGHGGHSVVKALHSMDLRYPEVMEATVNAAMTRLGKEDASRKDKKKNRLGDALQAAFAGSLRAPMLEAGTTLALAVDAAAAGIRQMALERLDAIVSKGQGKKKDAAAAETEAVLHAAVLRRLEDDHPEVVQTALRLGSLLRLPPAALLEALSRCLSTAIAAATNTVAKKKDRAAARGVARSVVKLLTGPFIEKNPRQVDGAAELVLTAVLAAPHTRRVAGSAVKHGGRVERHPLLAALRSVDVDESGKQGTPKRAGRRRRSRKKGEEDEGELEGMDMDDATAAEQEDKSAEKAPGSTRRSRRNAAAEAEEEKEAAAAAEEDEDAMEAEEAAAGGGDKGVKGYDDASHNIAVVVALATRVARNEDAARALGRLMGSAHPRARALALVVANVALRRSGRGQQMLAGEVLQRAAAGELSQSDSAASSESTSPAAAGGGGVALEFNADTGIVDSATLLALANGTLRPSAVAPEVVLTALRTLPTSSLETMGQQGLERLFSRLCTMPEGNWRPQLDALVARAAEIDVTGLLADLWGAPVDSTISGSDSRVSTAALHMWTQAVLDQPPASPTKAARGRGKAKPAEGAAEGAPAAATVCALLPRLLCVLGQPDRAIRAAAVAAVRSLAGGLDVWWPFSFDGGEVAISRGTVASVLSGVASQAGIIVEDSEAAETLLGRAMEEEGEDAAPPATPATARKPRGTASKKKAAVTAAADALVRHSLGLPRADAASLGAFLLEQLPLQSGPAGLHCAPFIVRVIHDTAEPRALLLAARCLLSTFALSKSAGAIALRPLTTPLEREAAAELVQLFNDAALTAVAAAGGSGAKEEAQEVADALVAMLQVPGPEGSAEVRRAALTAVTATAFTFMPENAQRALFVALTGVSTRDDDEQCRASAHAALATLSVSAEMLLPLLTISTSDDAAKARTAKKRRAAQEVPTARTLDEEALSACVSTLEVLQWKQDVADALLMAAPLQATVWALLDAEAAARAAADAAEEAAAEGGDPVGDFSAAQAARAYAMQLALSLLHSLAQQHTKPAAAAVAALPPSATKSAKKGTKKDAVAAAPQQDSIFDIAVAVRCAQEAPDAAVRNAALALVTTLAAAHPEAALSHVLQVVAVISDASAELIDAHASAVAGQSLAAAATAWVHSGRAMSELVDQAVDAIVRAPPARRLPLLRALAAALSEVEGTCMVILALLQRQLTAIDGEEESQAWVELSGTLTKNNSALIQAQTLALLLHVCMERSARNPAAPIVLLATAFASNRIAATPARPAADDAEDAELQAAYETLMQRALAQLQRAGELAARPAASSSAAPPPELLKTATTAAYALTQALRHVMAPAAYVTGLVGLISGPSDKVRRRAMALLEAAVSGVEDAGDDAPVLASAALAALEPLQALLGDQLAKDRNAEPRSDVTKQVALGTLAALAVAFGGRHPRPFVAAVPAVLALTKSSARQAVRSSALACLGGVVRALGAALMPALPSTVSAVLAAADHAVAEVREAAGPKGSPAAAEASALELAAVLGALGSLVSTLGAFLAPHLAQVLEALLSPIVLSSSAGRCNELAGSIRKELASNVAPRLLLGPLADRLEPTAKSGTEPTIALLSMLRTVVEKMDGEAVASYHDAVFLFLLRALDLRRTQLSAPSASAAADRTEAAAVGAMVELTLKLTESKFKPLFFRLAEWATSPPPAAYAAAASPLPRAVALLAVANALSERLRSTFTPYFRHLIDPVLSALDGSGDGAAPAKKKRKKAGAPLAGEVPPALAPLGTLARLLAVRALHRCFLYDASGFLDEARFDKLLTPLVQQLHFHPPAEHADALPADAALEGALPADTSPDLDSFGRATVACLAQMALAAGGSDGSRWRPLNHAVLQATRAPDTATRLAALEAAAAMAAALQEEYLALLPETLPFLGELLEDQEHVVEARATEVLRMLEGLTGEGLGDYLRA